MLAKLARTVMCKSVQKQIASELMISAGLQHEGISLVCHSLLLTSGSNPLPPISVLGSKAFGNFAIADWRFGPKYIVTILSCQHQEKVCAVLIHLFH